jgi:hypothetical protein
LITLSLLDEFPKLVPQWDWQGNVLNGGKAKVNKQN